MGHPAPAPLTPTGPVHWTRFEAAALPVDWTDHKAAHRQIMALFPRDLPGDPHARRANHGILYRLDHVEGITIALVQSHVAPILLPAAGRTMVIPDHVWNFQSGDKVAFRLAVNPVARTGRTKPGYQHPNGGFVPTERPGPKERVIPFSEVPQWVNAKTAASLTDVTILDHYRDTTTSGRQRLNVDTIDATATITDPAAFDTLRRVGIGKGKSYGAGLLTARPAT